MPMQWNDQADARLFANVLKLHVVKLDYPALAKAMGVTPKAISHRISKIKEKALAYNRNNPYAFDPEPSHSSKGKHKRGAGGKKMLKGKDMGFDDDEVKREPGVKMEYEGYASGMMMAAGGEEGLETFAGHGGEQFTVDQMVQSLMEQSESAFGYPEEGAGCGYDHAGGGGQDIGDDMGGEMGSEHMGGEHIGASPEL